MKILFVITCLSYGGAEKNLGLVAEYFAKNGHEVSICNFRERETCKFFSAEIVCYEKPEEKRRLGKLSYFGMVWRQYRFLLATCREVRPDVIVSFLDMPNALSVICGRKLGIPVIISERADPYQPAALVTRLLRKLFVRADGAVFQTEGARDYYPSELGARSAVIPNPVICKDGQSAVWSYDSAEEKIAFVGRFELRQKRQDVMLDAMKLIVAVHPEYKLVFWGSGEDEDAIRALVTDKQLSDNVIFAGVSKQVPEDVSRCKVFAITSDYEGIPNSLIEAMTVGIPCVSTDCSPGGARMLIDGSNGTVVPCGDPQAIADVVINYIENKDIAKAHGEKAMEIKEKFSHDVIMGKWGEYVAKTVEKYNKD